jgi:class 3 adenylate cyclase/tetratricopeptide (TPR) repeat protein
VLFADIVGFTSLSETLDPEQVKNLVDRTFERLVTEIQAYGGVVDKFIGDALVALFGAPIAHEDDPERAVRAALQMQAVVTSNPDLLGTGVQMRIGVNTGEVLVGALRAGGDYTAMGDVVNTAQRLESAARPGSVFVGEPTYLATRNTIRYDEVEALEAKGKEQPLPAWEARDALLPPGYRQRRDTPLVGRDAELGTLRHAVEIAVERRRAHFILLLGEAGVGKTRLAEEVAQLAACNHDAVVLEGRCVPYGEANVWWPVAEALRQACGFESGAPAEVAEERTRATLARALDQADDSPEVGQLSAGLLHLIGYEGWLRDLDPMRAREEATHALLTFLEAASATQPVVVVLSDLHWADEVVLELATALLERLGRAPVVLVATARPDLLDRWTAGVGRHNSLVLNLDPLSRAASSALLTALLGDPGDEDVHRVLLDRSGGNPFFLEELVALLDEGGPRTLDALPVQSPSGELPDTLRGLVAARLDGLTVRERHVLEDAAVWGRKGPSEALMRMAQMMRDDDEDLTPVLDDLVDKDVLRVDGDHWSFRSDLVREVAYSTLTKADRARRHYGIASYMVRHDVKANDPDMVSFIASHFGSAAGLAREMGSVPGVGADVEGEALDWLQRAGEHAQQQHMLVVAERLFSQALQLSDRTPSEQRVALLLGRGATRSERRELDLARADITEAIEAADVLGDEHGRARAAFVLGELLHNAGQLDDAAATLDDALARLRAVGDDRAVCETLRSMGLTHLFLGESERADLEISEALDIARGLGDRRLEAWAIQQLAWISFAGGRPDEADERLTTAIATFTEIGDQAGLAWAQGLFAFVRFQQGHLAEAEKLADEILLLAQSRGERWAEGMMNVLGASVRLWLGRTSEAIIRAEAAVLMFRDMGDEYGLSQGLACLGRALIAVGRIDSGFEVLEEAGRRGPVIRNSEIAAVGLTALANAAVVIGEPHRATAVLDLLERHGQVSANLGDSERLVALGLTHLQTGRVEEALRVLDDLRTSDSGDQSAFALSALTLTLAAAGHDGEVTELDARVRDMVRSTYLDRAMARIAHALVHARSRDEAAAGIAASLVTAVDATEDQTAQAIARLTRAYVLETLSHPEAAAARGEAENRLAELGLGAPGWRNAIELILTAAPASTSA